MKALKTIVVSLLGAVLCGNAVAQGVTNLVAQPLSLVNCLNLALQQSPAIRDARSDLKAQHGLVITTRAVALPRLQATGEYKYTDTNAIEGFPGANVPNRNWRVGVEIVQDIYDGGKSIAAVRAAGATKRQAIAQYDTAIADALLAVRVAYYDVLLASQQITVHEASVNLLQKELEDQQHRYEAGTVPKFNVLRAEVAVANERPNLIRARNDYRIAKNNLSNLLGYNLPRDIFEDVPMQLTDTLDDAPYQVNLPDAIQQALSRRSELIAMRENETLQKMGVINARAGYHPTLSVFAGYDWYNAQFTAPVTLGHDIHGWDAGARMTWNIFDGLATHGHVVQAKAMHEKSQTDLANESRQVELDVRTAYSLFIEAREVLDSQEKVQQEAEEALREANARAEAGTGTQLDVLDAETSLTQARTTQIQALHDYDTARARLQRAVGEDMVAGTK